MVNSVHKPGNLSFRWKCGQSPFCLSITEHHGGEEAERVQHPDRGLRGPGLFRFRLFKYNSRFITLSD